MGEMQMGKTMIQDGKPSKVIVTDVYNIRIKTYVLWKGGRIWNYD